MNNLSNLQKTFQLHILENDAQMVAQIVPPANDTIEARLAIYSDGYRLRLMEVLEIDFEILRKIIGEDEFNQLGLAYIEAYPSRHFAVDHLGKNFAKFLATYKPYCDQPHFSELATFISALSDTIDAADAPVLRREDLAAIPQEQWAEMRIALHPSVQLLTQHWNSLKIWQAANICDGVIPAPTRESAAVYSLVWRKGIQSFYNPLTQQEAAIIQALQDGLTFGEVCERLTEWLPEEEVAAFAVGFLLRALQDGWLSSVRLEA